MRSYVSFLPREDFGRFPYIFISSRQPAPASVNLARFNVSGSTTTVSLSWHSGAEPAPDDQVRHQRLLGEQLIKSGHWSIPVSISSTMAATTPYGPAITQRHPPVTSAGAGLIATAIIMPVFATLWTILRMWTRKIRGVSAWFTEDVLCYLAVVRSIGTCGCSSFADTHLHSSSSGVSE